MASFLNKYKKNLVGGIRRGGSILKDRASSPFDTAQSIIDNPVASFTLRNNPITKPFSMLSDMVSNPLDPKSYIPGLKQTSEAIDMLPDVISSPVIQGLNYPGDVSTGAFTTAFSEPVRDAEGRRNAKFSLGGFKDVRGNLRKWSKENPSDRNIGGFFKQYHNLRNIGSDEFQRSNLPQGVKTGLSIGLDPTMYIGPGAVGKAGTKAARISPKFSKAVLGTKEASATNPLARLGGGIFEGVGSKTPLFAAGAGAAAQLNEYAPEAIKPYTGLAAPILGGSLGARLGSKTLGKIDQRLSRITPEEFEKKMTELRKKTMDPDVDTAAQAEMDMQDLSDRFYNQASQKNIKVPRGAKLDELSQEELDRQYLDIASKDTIEEVKKSRGMSPEDENKYYEYTKTDEGRSEYKRIADQIYNSNQELNNEYIRRGKLLAVNIGDNHIKIEVDHPELSARRRASGWFLDMSNNTHRMIVEDLFGNPDRMEFRERVNINRGIPGESAGRLFARFLSNNDDISLRADALDHKSALNYIESVNNRRQTEGGRGVFGPYSNIISDSKGDVFRDLTKHLESVGLPKAATAGKWVEILNKFQVNKREMQENGLLELLNVDKKTVLTREDILQRVRENDFDIEESIFNTNPKLKLKEPELTKLDGDRYFYGHYDRIEGSYGTIIYDNGDGTFSSLAGQTWNSLDEAVSDLSKQIKPKTSGEFDTPRGSEIQGQSGTIYGDTSRYVPPSWEGDIVPGSHREIIIKQKPQKSTGVEWVEDWDGYFTPIINGSVPMVRGRKFHVSIRMLQNGMWQVHSPGGEFHTKNTFEEAKKLGELYIKNYDIRTDNPRIKNNQFREDEIDVLAHSRVVDLDEGKTLGVVEIQSDWAQENRAADKQLTNPSDEYEGRVHTSTDRKRKLRHEDFTIEAFSAFNPVTNSYNDKWVVSHESGVYRYFDHEPTKQDLDQIIDQSLDDIVPEFPKHPFEDNWQALSVKRIMRYAAENGYDKVRFITGEETLTIPGMQLEKGSKKEAGRLNSYNELLPQVVNGVAKKLGMKVDKVQTEDSSYRVLDPDGAPVTVDSPQLRELAENLLSNSREWITDDRPEIIAGILKSYSARMEDNFASIVELMEQDLNTRGPYSEHAEIAARFLGLNITGGKTSSYTLVSITPDARERTISKPSTMFSFAQDTPSDPNKAIREERLQRWGSPDESTRILEQQRQSRIQQHINTPESAERPDINYGIDDYLSNHPEIGDRDAHGIVASDGGLNQLINLLTNGVDKNRSFHTVNVAGRGGIMADRVSDPSSFIVLGKEGQLIKDGGIDSVIVSNGWSHAIPSLQERFPDIKFIDAVAETGPVKPINADIPETPEDALVVENAAANAFDGNKPPGGGSGVGGGDNRPIEVPESEAPGKNKYLGFLRPIDEVVQGVYTSENPIIRGINKVIPVNPSVLMNSPVGKVIVAYTRQKLAAENLVNSAMNVFDAQGAKLGTKLIMDQFGENWNKVVSNVIKKNDVIIGGTFWNKLTPEQKKFVQDIHWMIDDVNNMRRAGGLVPYDITLKNGEFWVPRQVQGVADIEFHRPSNHNLDRIWEDATEAAKQGVNYADPRETMKLYIYSTYKELIDKQFADAMQKVTTGLLDTINPSIKARLIDAQNNVSSIEKQLAEAKNNLSQDPSNDDLKVIKLKLSKDLRTAKKNLRLAQFKADTDMNRIKSQEFDRQKGWVNGREQAMRVFSVKGTGLRAVTPDDYELLNKWIGISGKPQKELESPLLAGLGAFGRTVRLSASFDLATPFIHGLPLLFNNPVGWSKVVRDNAIGFFSPERVARSFEKDREIINEMAANGISIRSGEFFEATRARGEVRRGYEATLGKVPGVGKAGKIAGKQTFGRFETAMEASLLRMRIELWKANKESFLAKGSDLEGLSRYVRNMTGDLDARALMVGKGQRDFESTFLAFSPRLFRSTMALAGMAMKPTSVEGLAALRSLAIMAGGATLIFYLGSVMTRMAQGESKEEAFKNSVRSINPTTGREFLSIKTPYGYFGIGGQIRAISELLVRSVSTLATGNFEGFNSTDQNENPILRFYMGRGAPGVKLVQNTLEFSSGGKLDANPYEDVEGWGFVKQTALGFLPYTAQDIIKSGTEGLVSGEDLIHRGASFNGLRTNTFSRADETKMRIQALGFIDINGKPITKLDQMNKEQKAQYYKSFPVERANENDNVTKLFNQIGMIEDQFQAELLAATAKVEQGRMTKEQFRKWFNDARTIKFNQIDAVKKTFSNLPADRPGFSGSVTDYINSKRTTPEDRAVDKYYSISSNVPLMDDGTVDYDAISRERQKLLNSFDPKVRAYVERQINRPSQTKANKLVTEYDIAKDVAKPYFESKDTVFEMFKGTSFFSQFNSYDAFEKWIAKSAEEAGLTPSTFYQMLSSSNKEVKAFQLYSNKYERYMRLMNPELDRVLVQWYGFEPANRIGYAIQQTTGSDIGYSLGDEIFNNRRINSARNTTAITQRLQRYTLRS